MSLSAHLAELSEKHKLLQRKIEAEQLRPGVDETHLRRLKREKLKLKETISKLSGATQH
jgi:hypothetical protein